MRSKAPLAMMEQLVMILVFALAAALCVQVFALSDRISRRGAARDQALLEAQSAAELLKATGGDFAAAAAYMGGESDAQGFSVTYDADWTPAAEPARYVLSAGAVESGVSGLSEADVWVRDVTQKDALLQFRVAWQTEVTDHG